MSSIQLLIVPQSKKVEIEASIDSVAVAKWRDRLWVHELTKGADSRKPVAAEILSTCEEIRGRKVFLAKGIAFDNQVFIQANQKYEVLPATYQELARPNSRALRSFLAQHNLDCEWCARNGLAIWMHGEGGESSGTSMQWIQPRIETWRRQFLRVDPNGGGVVDELLRQLEVMPTSYVATCIKQYGLQGPYGFVQDSFGKSWGSVTAALSKNRTAGTAESSVQLLPIHEAIPVAAESGLTLRVIEDGLFSGTELLGVIESLMGERRDNDPRSRQKTQPLSSPDQMYKAKQQWAYGCVTDYGQLIFNAMTRIWGFDNVSLHIHEKTKRISVLKPGAEEEAKNRLARMSPILASGNHAERKSALRDFRSALDQCVVPAIQGISDVSQNCSLTERSRALLKRIGRELWRSYLTRKHGEFDQIRWSEERIERCGLGMSGMGLAFSFSHSIPKAALPVLWASGKVTASDGTMIDWQPLFPNAE